MYSTVKESSLLSSKFNDYHKQKNAEFKKKGKRKNVTMCKSEMKIPVMIKTERTNSSVSCWDVSTSPDIICFLFLINS